MIIPMNGCATALELLVPKVRNSAEKSWQI